MTKPTRPVRDSERVIPDKRVPGMKPNANAVARLLERSRALHRSALPAGNRKQRPTNWVETLKEAKALREQAFALDPNRETRGWLEEQDITPSGFDSHVVLTAFYGSL